MKKRIFSILLSICMMLALFPTVALAANSWVYVAGETLDESGYYGISTLDTKSDTPPTTDDKGYVHWDNSTSVLTLYGVTITDGGIGCRGDFTIALAEGTTNNVTNTSVNVNDGNGINLPDGSIKIMGEGTLNVNGAANGIWCTYTVSITDGVNLNVVGNNGMGIVNQANTYFDGVVIDASSSAIITGSTYGIGTNLISRAPIIRSANVTVKGGIAAFHYRTVPSFESGIGVLASTAIDGANPETYVSSKNSDYKWVKSSALASYDVKYLSGIYGTGNEVTDTKIQGSDLTLKGAIFTRNSFTQTGWATSDGGAQAYALGGTYSTDAAVTLYPVWTASEYIVSFAANGGTGTMADVTGISGDYVLPACGFTAPAGQQFKAWSVGGDEKGAGATINVTANTTVTAIWENIPVTYYTVTFDSAGGSVVTAQSIEVGQKATRPTDPTKDGFDFKGWTLNGSAYDFNTAVNGNITLVATWEQQQVIPTTYTVSFAANGGTGTMADVTGISGEYTLPANGFTAPDGKQFKAWSVGGSEKAVGDKITVSVDTTVTAVWEDIPAGHTCDITPVTEVEPSCTEGGKEAYYKCDGCGKFFEDALGAKEITDLAAWGNIGANGHTESAWKSDKDNHWKECTVAACGAIIENSKATHADANNDGKCDTCEYNVGTTTTNPDDTNKPSDDVQSPQTSDNSHIALWHVFIFISGGAVIMLTVVDKKRRYTAKH